MADILLLLCSLQIIELLNETLYIVEEHAYVFVYFFDIFETSKFFFWQNRLHEAQPLQHRTSFG